MQLAELTASYARRQRFEAQVLAAAILELIAGGLAAATGAREVGGDALMQQMGATWL